MSQDNGINEPQTEEQARAERREEATKQMEAFVKRIIGQSLGSVEETLKSVERLVTAQTELVRLIDNRVEQLELHGIKPVDSEHVIQVTESEGVGGPEIFTRIPEKSIRRRIGHTISTKGIHQYEGTVEGTNISQEEIFAARLAMDVDLRRLQPIYEEFVEASVPGLTGVTAVELVSADSVRESVANDSTPESSSEETPAKRGPGRPPKGT